MFKKETNINLAPINTPVFACFKSGQKRVIIIILQNKETLEKSWIFQDECYVIPSRESEVVIDYILIEENLENLENLKETENE
jgi:hypothetical protein